MPLTITAPLAERIIRQPLWVFICISRPRSGSLKDVLVLLVAAVWDVLTKGGNRLIIAANPKHIEPDPNRTAKNISCMAETATLYATTPPRI